MVLNQTTQLARISTSLWQRGCIWLCYWPV